MGFGWLNKVGSVRLEKRWPIKADIHSGPGTPDNARVVHMEMILLNS